MKNLAFVLLFIVSISQISSQIAGTTIVGGCSTVTVTSVPQYQKDLLIQGFFKKIPNDNCNILYSPCPGIFARSRHWLEIKNSNGAFTIVQGPVHGDNAIFSNISIHGIYRVRTELPTKSYVPGCDGNGRKVLCETTLQFLGWEGEFKTESNPSFPGVYYYSNEVPVGIVIPSDIAYNFVDGGGGDNIPNGFDYDELVRMDASASKNYNAWWLAIFELGGQQRYRSNGWTSGQVGMIDLTALWNGGPADNWHFETLNSYMIQFAIVNEQCQIQGQWTNLDKAFFVCPTGSGCKFKKPENSISIYPNPVNHHFRFTGIDFTPINKFEYEIRSMDGKLVKRQFILDPSTNYSLDGVQSGIYLVSLYKDDQRIFNTKLSVVK